MILSTMRMLISKVIGSANSNKKLEKKSESTAARQTLQFQLVIMPIEHQSQLAGSLQIITYVLLTNMSVDGIHWESLSESFISLENGILTSSGLNKDKFGMPYIQ